MHFIRRAAFRAAQSPSLISTARPISTSTPFVLRSKTQSAITPQLFRRFTSDESNQEEHSGLESADGENHSIREAVGAAKESASELASDSGHDIMNAAAAGAAAVSGSQYQPREERRPYRNSNDRDNSGSREFGQQRTRVTKPTNSIYIGNLLFDVTTQDLEREFSAFGPVVKTTLGTDFRGLSKGFGYVEFETVDQAAAAIEAKHQTVFEGRRIVVNYMAKSSRAASPNDPSKTLFIGNLAFEMSDADLNKLFRNIRNVIDVRVAIDRRTGQPRGFAHADFVDIDSATEGKNLLSGKEVYGRYLRVDYSSGSKVSRDSSNSPSRRDEERSDN